MNALRISVTLTNLTMEKDLLNARKRDGKFLSRCKTGGRIRTTQIKAVVLC
jgi:hypothetical protein